MKRDWHRDFPDAAANVGCGLVILSIALGFAAMIIKGFLQ